MARSHGRIMASIWAPGSDFLKLDSGAQRQYMFLLSQQDLSHAGLLPLRGRRWANSAPDLTPEIVALDLKALEAARYVLVDEDTEEVLVRTYVRGDHVYKQPKVMIRMGEDARQMQSARLRLAFAAEMRRLPLEELAEGPRAVAVAVVETLLAEFDPDGITDPDTHPEGYGEGFLEGTGRVPDTHPDTHPDTPLRAGDRVPLPPSPIPLPPEKTPSPPVQQPALDVVTPDGATVRPKLDDQFDEFWQAYPRKVGKQDARTAWDRARKRAAVHVILDGALRFAADPNRPTQQFIPHPSTWLTRGGWDDEPCPPSGASASTTRPAQGHADHWAGDGNFGMPGATA